MPAHKQGRSTRNGIIHKTRGEFSGKPFGHEFGIPKKKKYLPGFLAEETAVHTEYPGK